MEATKPKTKKPTPQERWKELVGGRMSDKQIFDLFDEFGMARRLQTKDDYGWVKHNLPNIPEEMKKVLKFESDKENASRKETEKARADAVKAAATAAKAAQKAASGQGGPGMAYDGQGGINPLQEATKLGYTAQDFANDPNFNTYWANKTVDQLKQGLMKRSDFDPVAGKKKTVAPVPASNNTAPNVPANSGTPAANPTNPYSTSKDFSMIKFSSDPNGPAEGDANTVWLVDNVTKSFRPIMSMQAIRDLYADDQSAQIAINAITTVSPAALQPNGLLAGYTDLGVDYGMFEGGKTKTLEFNPIDLKNAYGQTKSQAKLSNGVAIYNSWMKFLQKADSGIDNTFLSKIASDKNMAAFYINALAYGNYTPDDIYKDIKRQELVSKGDSSLANVKIINENIDRNEYAKTSTGNQALSTLSINPPPKIGGMSREVWNSPAAILSQDYYNLADPASYDPTSTEFKDALGTIKTEYHDYLLQSLSATKDSDKAIADNKLKEYRDQLEKTYGYKLSDNALEAWRQLEKLDASAADAGISGSGIAEEKQDEALRDYREKGTRLRDAKATELSTQEGTVAKASYSPDQIQKLIEEDKAKGLPRTQWRAYKWGLVPEKEVTLAGFIAEHRANYPAQSNMTDAEIKERYYDNIYDQNGNLRSTLYKNYQDNVNKTKFGWSFNELPGTSIEQTKINTLAAKKLKEEEALQKTAANYETGTGLFNATQGAPTIPYEDPSIKSAQSAYNTTEADRIRAQEDKARIDAAAAVNQKAINAAKNISSAPAGKEYIPNVESKKNYTNITAPDANKRIYGTLKTSAPAPVDPTAGRIKIPNLANMAKHKATDYDRIGTSVYLKAGVKPLW